MKRIILSTAILLFAHTLLAQQDSNWTVKKEFYPSNKKLMREYFYDENNVLQKSITYASTDGKVIDTEILVKGTIYKIEEYFHPGGELKKVYEYDRETKKYHGEFKIFNLNGIKTLETNYEQGMISGYVKYFHDNGNLQSHVTYNINHLIEGNIKVYYEDGSVSAELSMKNGYLDGTCKTYYNSKYTKSPMFLDSDTYTGAVIFNHFNDYDRYKLGNYENYGLLCEATFSTGKLNGSYIIFYDNENPMLTATYVNGKLSSYEKFDRNKQLIKSSSSNSAQNNGKGYSSVNETSQSPSEFFIKNGVLHEKIDEGTYFTEKTFASNSNGNILGFVKGNWEGAEVIVYWTANNEAFICILSSTGGWTTRKDLSCQCFTNNGGITNISFSGKDTLIISCTNGKAYKKTPYSESSY